MLSIFYTSLQVGRIVFVLRIWGQIPFEVKGHTYKILKKCYFMGQSYILNSQDYVISYLKLMQTLKLWFSSIDGTCVLVLST